MLTWKHCQTQACASALGKGQWLCPFHFCSAAQTLFQGLIAILSQGGHALVPSIAFLCLGHGLNQGKSTSFLITVLFSNGFDLLLEGHLPQLFQVFGVYLSFGCLFQGRLLGRHLFQGCPYCVLAFFKVFFKIPAGLFIFTPEASCWFALSEVIKSDQLITFDHFSFSFSLQLKMQKI